MINYSKEMAEIVKKSKDYGKGKIYMIRCNKTQLIYIGSTTKQYLSQRMGRHVACYKHWTNGKGPYMSSFDIIKNGDYIILLVELYPCKSNDELRMREQYHIDLNVWCMNKNRAYSTAEQHKAQIKEYYETHKEAITEQKKGYYEAHKEENAEYHKEYCEEHREEKAKYDKKYREANKEAITEQRKVKITCSCGAVICQYDKSKHERTKKHISRTLCPPL